MKKSINLFLIIVTCFICTTNINASKIMLNTNPLTGDDILIYIAMLIFGIIGLGFGLAIIKKKGTK